jgi:hypothetical protein
LQQENISTADILLNFHSHFTIAKSPHQGFAWGHSKNFTNPFVKNRIGITGKNFQFTVHEQQTGSPAHEDLLP